MKNMVIGLVVVIVTLGGLQVAQSEDLKQIQDEVRQVVMDQLAAIEKSPKNLYDMENTIFRVDFYQRDPSIVKLEADEFTSDGQYTFNYEWSSEFIKRLSCWIAAEYYRRTRFQKTACNMTYFVKGNIRIWEWEFDGSNCYKVFPDFDWTL